ncbi:DUF5319 domain-containing protein [Corynebacterium otitidis]|uniref:DUF5319 domain-containing protein n=1 Tax=Corynebacterium otitidis ATCC 51513 TaxID=883169 RepID=K0YDL9_9CORY|nr:DUF5319 domain-containing protein [Corynebacterium otitidis]EJZ81582.1 hypothetical protein HMPREF9719_01497 [Corynebacterium otitidis ATCC 51513]KKO84006.1 hypothetical protein AAV33_03480 [Corynebacterium otitidis]
MFFDSQMPEDPFANDPRDPAAFLMEDEEFEPLSDEERAGVQRDLTIALECERMLAPKGVHGIFFYCEECAENHYFSWTILISNMRATLADNPSPIHEPGADINPANYVPWEYAVGYVDGAAGR